ncbi:MAG: CysS/YqeB C-terminal domain-containing protein [Acidimicrobiales bacterium]
MSTAALPRILTIMGSGETSPTMVKTHRHVLKQMGPPPVPAVLLDTPFGFQENAADLAAKAQAYFAESLGTRMEVASFTSAVDIDPLAYEQMLAQVRQAHYVFAGPGSPTYALSQWSATTLPQILADKLERGGAITFASAAALTLGVACVPVYEIYKVGQAPHWLDGLDLLAAAGLRAAVIPHYNNAEGTNHDTRFCYLGERRLAQMEAELPGDAFVLGIDEHTGLVLDLDHSVGMVVGLGMVTVRAGGNSFEYPSGASMAISELAERANDLASVVSGSGSSAAIVAKPGPGEDAVGAETSGARPSGSGRVGESPFMAAVRGYESEFATGVAQRDVARATAAMLGLDDEIRAWAADSLQSDDMDRAQAALRHMIVTLGQLAETGARDPRLVVAPFVEAMLAVRDQARAEKRWADADTVRDRLLAADVEIRDGTEGTEWSLRDGRVTS